MKYKFFIIYMLVISLIAVLLTIYDKKSAVKGGQRIRERTLMIVSLLGGSAAMFITMRIIRHKTRHLKFMLGIPLIFIFQTVFIFWLRYKYGI